VASATGAVLLILHPKLLRSRLILIAAGWIPRLVGCSAVARVLWICSATCGITFPFFDKLCVHEPTGITQCPGTCVGRSAETTEVSKGEVQRQT